ncbi:MAG: NAD(P)-dependent alcohol dehydrogenase [Chitinophagaceae bacterium]|jgi:NADPH:quinone reductase-like Zn-dependent oxidoreductase|nr:NAD(P)-dependent alcohol dehydrogenase [Chitinophagaceae bacterium]
MKASIYTNYGQPEVLQLKEIATPVPKDNEVLIKIYAATVNRTDSGFLTGKPYIARLFSGILKPRNQITGNEFAGMVTETGKNVTAFKPGDKVFGYNDVTFGTHAEYICMKEDAPIALMPSNIRYEEAAPLTEGAHYALCDLRAAKIKSGQQILINGATGAIGSAAVQLAKYFGATVTAVCDTDHIDLIQSLGADMVIDYKKEDFTQLKQSFDFIFDAVGKSTFGKCKPLLSKKGIYISTELGPMSQNPFLALITPLFGGKKLLFPIPTISQADVVFLKELAEAGHFKPVIDRTYDLNEIADAYRYVLTGQKTGNVVIRIAQE